MTVSFVTDTRSDDEWLLTLASVEKHYECYDNDGWSTTKLGPQAQIQETAVGGGNLTAGITANPMMPRALPTRRGLQALALILATAYATILIYQAVAPRQVMRTHYFLLHRV